MKNISIQTFIILVVVLWHTLFIISNGFSQRVGAGGWHTLVVCSDSTVKAFGENATGQLGNGTNDDSNVPVPSGNLTGVIAVCGGGDQLEAHSMALKADGTVWAWGSNIYGGLGNGLKGTENNTNTPGQVLLLSNVKAISCGGWHSVALKNDGTVWAWGWNKEGQLGDGTFNDKTIPSQVPGLNNVIAIAAGTYHTLALKSDSTVWAWGDNKNGQIGNDTSGNDVNVPVQVKNLSGVVAIYAGRFFSLAVKADGTVWTWGEDLYGQLGNGATTDSDIPIQVPGLKLALPPIVCTGAFHCMAVKSDNTVVSWGRNTYGNLGDNTTNNRSTPGPVPGLSDVAGLAAGTNFTLIYKKDGSFWGCGRNASGQLGDGTNTQRNEPTLSNLVCKILLNVASSVSYEMSDVWMRMYPNPTKGLIHLQMPEMLNSEAVSVEVKNSLGQTVYHMPTLSDDLDLSFLNSGNYFLIVRAGEHVFTRMFVKE
ncbi:MAG: T9SS type A sorting domain-containing protein [Chitinophagales bacterium]|nr:T9SS type A sorting domain-containing protein [Chitinophagales bacterium]